MSAAGTRDLARVLTLRDLVLIVVGTTIGSGIFTVPGSVLRQSGGDLGVALVVWVGLMLREILTRPPMMMAATGISKAI